MDKERTTRRYQQHMTLNLLRAVMCCYQQWILLWGGDGRQEEQEEEEKEAVWFHRGRYSHLSKEGSEELEEN